MESSRSEVGDTMNTARVRNLGSGGPLSARPLSQCKKSKICSPCKISPASGTYNMMEAAGASRKTRNRHGETAMRLLSLILSVLCVASCICAGNAVADCPHREYGWSRTAGSPAFDQARGVAVDTLGNTYAVGLFEGKLDFDPSKRKDQFKSKGKNDAYVTGYSPDGVYRWTRAFRGADYDIAFGVAATPGENIAVTGKFQRRVDPNVAKNFGGDVSKLQESSKNRSCFCWLLACFQIARQVNSGDSRFSSPS